MTRFYDKIAKVTGVRREAKARGRPRLSDELSAQTMVGQGALLLWSIAVRGVSIGINVAPR